MPTLVWSGSEDLVNATVGVGQRELGLGLPILEIGKSVVVWRLSSNKAEPMPVAGDAVVGASSICPPSVSPLTGWIIKAIGLEVKNANEPTSTWWDS